MPCVRLIAFADAGVVEQAFKVRLEAGRIDGLVALAAEKKKGGEASAALKAELEAVRKGNAKALARPQKLQKVHGETVQNQGRLASWDTSRGQG